MLLNSNQLAEAVNFAPQTIYNYVKEGIITPTEVAPNGGYFFSDDLVADLLVKQAVPMLKESTLVLKFAENEEEFRAFEKAFDEMVKEKSCLRVDNLPDYMRNLKEHIKRDASHKRLLLSLFVDMMMKECCSQSKRLREKAQSELLKYSALEDLNTSVVYLRNLMDQEEADATAVSDKDRSFVNAVFSGYQEKCRRLQEKYCVTEMEGVAEKLKTPEQVSYEPESATARKVWLKAEQKYFRDTVNQHIKQNLSKGYFSLLGIMKGEEGNIYKFLTKAASGEFKRIEIYGYQNTLPAEKEGIDFLRDTKKVVIADEFEAEE